MSVTRACGMPHTITVGQHGGMIGPPTCGTRTVTIGQTCMSVTRAAGGMWWLSSVVANGRKAKGDCGVVSIPPEVAGAVPVLARSFVGPTLAAA
jgi:hypothetical protein